MKRKNKWLNVLGPEVERGGMNYGGDSKKTREGSHREEAEGKKRRNGEREKVMEREKKKKGRESNKRKIKYRN